MTIYFAAPLFNAMERAFNEAVVRNIEPQASVFLPQRDGALLADLIARGVLPDVAERLVYQRDVDAMAEADLVIAVLDGGHIDEGVAFEIGFMKALGKRCVGLQTDVRRALPTGNNPMIGRSLERVFSSPEALVEWLLGEVGMGALGSDTARTGRPEMEL